MVFKDQISHNPHINMRFTYEQESNNLDREGIVIFNNRFSQDLIERLDQISENVPSRKGKTGPQGDTNKYNNRDIKYLTLGPHTQWLYEYLFECAVKANEKYKFDIDFVTDPIHYVTYPKDGGFLAWHQDIGFGGTNQRKLAMTVQLSEPSEYEGGDFQVWIGGDESNIQTIPRKKGDIAIFPAYLMHRVTPITRGERKCLVFWTGGRPLR